MKLAVRLMVAAFALVAFTTVQTAKAAPATWTGKISDKMCGADHKANGGTMQKDHDCAVSCAKNGSFVFVNGADKKVFDIGNQKDEAIAKQLNTHAGHTVEIAGEVKGSTITISKVTMLPVK